MLTVIEKVFTPQQAANILGQLTHADWQDGRKTAGTLATQVKTNLQLDDKNSLAIQLGNQILQTLGNNHEFIAVALPEKIYPPKFNCYKNGGAYGAHVDSALMILPESQRSLRTDISATLFFSEPDSYDGGELEIETPFGVQAVKLNAGDLVIYPSTSLHRVTPVTRGSRVSAFFWIQSMVRSEAQRTLLYDLDKSIQSLSEQKPKDDADLLRLSGVYHNLLRLWAEV